MSKFIVVEGLEGAGKSSSIIFIAKYLQEHGITDIEFTREPGGTSLAERIRALTKEVHREPMAPQTELLLMYAARAQLLYYVIYPALSKGNWVIGDRHDLSSQAYQGGGRGLDAEMMSSIKKSIIGDFKPDLTLYLDIDPNVGMQRIRSRGYLDRIESEEMAFFERTRARYLELAALDDTIEVINADQPVDLVRKDIASAIDKHLFSGA